MALFPEDLDVTASRQLLVPREVALLRPPGAAPLTSCACCCLNMKLQTERTHQL
ncbi:MAG TPA: hypothetical protein G4N94_02615 [Caldilineae bacterium]|nr:hypothetical protein [Caldilineae bacterium]